MKKLEGTIAGIMAMAGFTDLTVIMACQDASKELDTPETDVGNWSQALVQKLVGMGVPEDTAFELGVMLVTRKQREGIDKGIAAEIAGVERAAKQLTRQVALKAAMRAPSPMPDVNGMWDRTGLLDWLREKGSAFEAAEQATETPAPKHVIVSTPMSRNPDFFSRYGMTMESGTLFRVRPEITAKFKSRFTDLKQMNDDLKSMMIAKPPAEEISIDLDPRLTKGGVYDHILAKTDNEFCAQMTKEMAAMGALPEGYTKMTRIKERKFDTSTPDYLKAMIGEAGKGLIVPGVVMLEDFDSAAGTDVTATSILAEYVNSADMPPAIDACDDKYMDRLNVAPVFFAIALKPGETDLYQWVAPGARWLNNWYQYPKDLYGILCHSSNNNPITNEEGGLLWEAMQPESLAYWLSQVTKRKVDFPKLPGETTSAYAWRRDALVNRVCGLLTLQYMDYIRGDKPLESIHVSYDSTAGIRLVGEDSTTFLDRTKFLTSVEKIVRLGATYPKGEIIELGKVHDLPDDQAKKLCWYGVDQGVQAFGPNHVWNQQKD